MHNIIIGLGYLLMVAYHRTMIAYYEVLLWLQSQRYRLCVLRVHGTLMWHLSYRQIMAIAMHQEIVKRWKEGEEPSDSILSFIRKYYPNDNR